MEGPVERMKQLFAEKDFINLSQPKEQPLRRRKAPIALGALVFFMLGGALNPGLIPVLALAAVIITLVARCIDPADAYEAVEWKVIFMIFGMLGLGMALKETELARVIAQGAVDTFGEYGPQMMLIVMYLQRRRCFADADFDRCRDPTGSGSTALCGGGDVCIERQFCHPDRLPDQYLRLWGWRLQIHRLHPCRTAAGALIMGGCQLVDPKDLAI